MVAARRPLGTSRSLVPTAPRAGPVIRRRPTLTKHAPAAVAFAILVRPLAASRDIAAVAKRLELSGADRRRPFDGTPSASSRLAVRQSPDSS